MPWRPPRRKNCRDRLNARNGQSLRELSEGLDMSRQAVSKHLAVLEAARLVTPVRYGRLRLHYLNPIPIHQLADRWIGRYERGRLTALSHLKRSLEGPPVSKPEFVYVTYIQTTAEKLYRALTDPEFIKIYMGGYGPESEWRVGSPVKWKMDPNGEFQDLGQRVLEAEPGRRLSYTWHTLQPIHRELFDSDKDFAAACQERSRVTFDIEPAEIPEMGIKLTRARSSRSGGVDTEAVDEGIQVRRDQLVAQLRASGRVLSERVAEAFRAVPRHLFLPEVEPERAYGDEAFPIKYDDDGRPISSSSQPAIMARMLEQLDVAPGHRVLEIGAGTGYNAALLAHLVGPTGSVVTIDIDDDLVSGAREHLAACGLTTVAVNCGDGGFGWPEQAPYDRIIVTVGAWDLVPAWTQQLAPTGRLVVPLDLRGVQRSIAFEPAGELLEGVSIVDCGFMRMRGGFAGPETIHPLGSEPGVFVQLNEPRSVNTNTLAAALTQPGEDVASGVHVTLAEVWGGLSLWLALQEPDLAWISAIGAAADRGLVPALIAFPGHAGTVALLDTQALAALVRLPDDGQPQADAFELAARPFGQNGSPLAERLVAHLQAWNVNGRPSTADLRITAHPPHAGNIADADAVIEKHHTRLALSWPRSKVE